MSNNSKLFGASLAAITLLTTLAASAAPGVATGKPCKARHYHGFNGIEDQVIADIAAWIKAPTP